MSGQSGALAVALLLSLTLAGDAAAETVAQTARKWGLIGPWSQDCSLKPDRDKGTVFDFEIAGDERVLQRRGFGDTSDESEVVSAEASSDGLLNLLVFFPRLKQTRAYGLRMQPDGTMRTMYNRNQKQEYTIRDGKYVAEGSPTPSLRKCR